MAIKDWRNLMDTDERISYENERRKEKIVIIPYGDIRVFVVKTMNPTKSFINRRFKSKPQAMTYAKNYMRSH